MIARMGHLLLAFCAISLLSVGCSSSIPNQTDPADHVITGKVTVDGGPMRAADPDIEFLLAFVKMEGDARPDEKAVLSMLGIDTEELAGGAAPPGVVGADEGGGDVIVEQAFFDPEQPGHYQVQLDKGKYLVVVRHFPNGPDSAAGNVDRADKFRGRYSTQKSDLIFEINEDKTINLDLKTKK